jgi:hypothetical protein
MSRLAYLDWKRVIFGLLAVGLAGYVGFFWERPRHDDNERYVQSNYQRDSGKWHTSQVTGADLNRVADDAAPLNRMVSAVIMLGGAAIVAYELRHLRK